MINLWKKKKEKTTLNTRQNNISNTKLYSPQRKIQGKIIRL